VLLGESLLAGNVKVSDLVQTWAKRGAETAVTKIEFRQHVRKLLDKSEAKQIDMLFESLDEDHGGTLDLGEIRAALKKLQDSAAVAAKAMVSTRAKMLRFKHLEELAQQALEATRTIEEASKEATLLSSNKSVSARLGAQILSKRMKVVDVVQKWDANGDGELDKMEFRQNVKALGVQAESAEIDELFDSLNPQNNPSINMSEIRVLLKTLTDDAIAVDKSIKDIKMGLADHARAARGAQLAYKKQQRENDAIDALEAEAAEREAEQKAAAAAELKAARAAIIAEKKAAAAAAKAAFEANVAAKRKDTFSC